MTQRAIDPKVRAVHAALRDYNEAREEQTRTLVEGKSLPKALASKLSKAEAALRAAHKTEAKGKCASRNCRKSIDFETDPHYRLTVSCLARLFPGEPQAVTHYLSPNAYGRFEQGVAGVIVQLEPPSTGELAYCLDCAAYLVEYLNDQLLPGESDRYRLHLRSYEEESGLRADPTTKAPTAIRRRSTRRPARKDREKRG